MGILCLTDLQIPSIILLCTAISDLETLAVINRFVNVTVSIQILVTFGTIEKNVIFTFIVYMFSLVSASFSLLSTSTSHNFSILFLRYTKNSRSVNRGIFIEHPPNLISSISLVWCSPSSSSDSCRTARGFLKGLKNNVESCLLIRSTKPIFLVLNFLIRSFKICNKIELSNIVWLEQKILGPFFFVYWAYVVQQYILLSFFQ